MGGLTRAHDPCWAPRVLLMAAMVTAWHAPGLGLANLLLHSCCLSLSDAFSYSHSGSDCLCPGLFEAIASRVTAASCSSRDVCFWILPHAKNWTEPDSVVTGRLKPGNKYVLIPTFCLHYVRLITPCTFGSHLNTSRSGQRWKYLQLVRATISLSLIGTLEMAVCGVCDVSAPSPGVRD